MYRGSAEMFFLPYRPDIQYVSGNTENGSSAGVNVGETMFQSFDDVTDPSHGKTRIKLLRGEMSSRGLDAFLVPHADEYMNEYVPPAGQRLHWLTGFSGSAGFAIVFKSDACIFVDGRYTLQVTGQVDTETFKIYHLIDEPPHTYLSRTAASGQRIGIRSALAHG